MPRTLVVKLLVLLSLLGSLNCKRNTTPVAGPETLKMAITAVQENDGETLKDILSAELVNKKDTTGTTLLTHSIISEHLHMTKLLLENGSDPNLKNEDYYQSTPLMNCWRPERLPFAKLLLKKGADPNIQDQFGDPAIHWAAYNGNTNFTKLLLKNGARTNIKSKHADGVLQVALKEYQSEIVDVLLQQNTDAALQLNSNNQKIVQAVLNGNEAVLEELVGAKHVHIKDQTGATLLILASEHGHLEIVAKLLDLGADINAMNSVGHTALNRATFLGQNEIARFLVKAGAKVDLTDKRFSLTPLIASVRSDNAEMMDCLLENGADINKADGINNFTPLMWATALEKIGFVEQILVHDPDLSIVSSYGTTVNDLTQNTQILELLHQKTKGVE